MSENEKALTNEEQKIIVKFLRAEAAEYYGMGEDEDAEKMARLYTRAADGIATLSTLAERDTEIKRLKRVAAEDTGVLREHSEEIKRLKEEDDEGDVLRLKLSNILTATANALKGKPKPLHQHSWHDLAEVAKRLKDELAKHEAMLPVNVGDCLDFMGQIKRLEESVQLADETVDEFHTAYCGTHNVGCSCPGCCLYEAYRAQKGADDV